MDAEAIGAMYGFNPEKSITVHNSDEVAIESCYRAVSGMARNLTQGIDPPGFSSLQRAQSNTASPALPPLYPVDNNGQELLMPPPLTRAVAWGGPVSR